MGSTPDQFPNSMEPGFARETNVLFKYSGEVMGTRHTDACLFQDDEVSHAVVIQRPRRSDPRYASSQDHDFGVKVLAGLAARDSANRQQEVNCSQSHFSSELYDRSRPLVSGIAAAQNLLPKMFRWRKRTYVRACANAIVTWYWCSASQYSPTHFWPPAQILHARSIGLTHSLSS